MGLNRIVLLAANDLEPVEKSLGETMNTALLNTIMGISIVFAVLLLISFIISLFKYINKAELAAKNRKEKNSSVPLVDAVLAQIVEREEEELFDDLELVAVITAAIHSYEESMGNSVPVNGLFVRSIKKVNKSRWLNA